VFLRLLLRDLSAIFWPDKERAVDKADIWRETYHGNSYMRGPRVIRTVEDQRTELALEQSTLKKQQHNKSLDEEFDF